MEETTKRNPEDQKWPLINMSGWDYSKLETSIVCVLPALRAVRLPERGIFKKTRLKLRIKVMEIKRDFPSWLRGRRNLLRWRLGEIRDDFILKLREIRFVFRLKLRKTRKR